jgi:Eco29kI restriction endonuclease
MTDHPYNPLDKHNLGRSVAEALLARPVASLSETAGLVGAGVYAIYYTGNFPSYAPVVARNRNDIFGQPIYVGKAIPKGARKGGLTFDAATGTALRDRLRTHSNSIREASNIDLVDFQFRSLVVDDVWIPLGENMLIQQFQPIWNRVIDGFGNKTPGARRSAQHRSLWDVIHPGRKFASKLADGGVKPSDIEERLAAYFSGQPVPLIAPEQATDSGDGDDDND